MTPSRAELSSLPSDIRDLLVRRSERIGKSAATADGEDDTLWVAAFSLGDREYALSLPMLRAAMPLRSVTRVPRSSRVVLGVLQFQGQVIAALSTATLLGSRWHATPTVLLVVDLGATRTVALDCVQVPVAKTLPLSAFREACIASDGPIVRVGVPGRAAVHVVDLAQLLDDQDWGTADE
ncbi:MAG TPA: chemotaxis protein CheW [Polyangiaceae bacterium]|nr:chemotaxis protein CheW [Polyangiaceae bacterium]